MKAIEVWGNGRRIFTAGLEDGAVDASLTIRNQVDPILFNVRGNDHQTGNELEWCHVTFEVGDEVTLKVVEISPVEDDQL